MRLFKSPTTPADPPRGVLDVLERAAGDEPLSAFLARVDRLVHGTTLATNVLLTESGARTGMLTTAGFRDVIEIRRGIRNLGSSMFDQFKPPYRPLVPRSRRLGIPERSLYTGEVEDALDVEAAERAIDRLLGDGLRGDRDLLLALLRRPRERAPRPRSRPATQPRDLRHLFARDPADARRVRAFLDHRGERVHRALGLELSLRPRAAPARRRAGGIAADHAQQRADADRRGVPRPRGRASRLRPGGRARGGARIAGAARPPGHPRGRHGRHQLRHVRDPRRPDPHHPRGLGGPGAGRDEDGGGRGDRRGRRLDRLDRQPRSAARRAAERRRRPRPGRLWTRRPSRP